MVGWRLLDGQALMNPGADGDTAVTLTATADTPLAGMPPCPVNCTSMTPFAGTCPVAPRLILVSSTRAGVSGSRDPGAVGVPPMK